MPSHPRYLDNICLHPEEEKYRKIKLQNKVFQVRAAAKWLLAGAAGTQPWDGGSWPAGSQSRPEPGGRWVNVAGREGALCEQRLYTRVIFCLLSPLPLLQRVDLNLGWNTSPTAEIFHTNAGFWFLWRNLRVPPHGSLPVPLAGHVLPPSGQGLRLGPPTPSITQLVSTCGPPLPSFGSSTSFTLLDLLGSHALCEQLVETLQHVLRRFLGAPLCRWLWGLGPIQGSAAAEA